MAVTFKLYQSDGTTLKYTFPVVISANYPYTNKTIIEHNNIRGKGSIIVNGGETSWDLILKGVLFANNYDALMALVDTLETSIEVNIPYVIKITKSQGSATTWSYNVKRITSIAYQEDNIRTNYLEYTVTLRVNCW
jgi:hypothetical protein